MSNPESTLDKAKAQAADMAEDARDSAAASAREEAEELRSRAVHEAEDAADAAEAARQEFDQDSLQAAALRQLGEQISNVADRIRDKPVDGMIDDIAVFARRNPLLFLGGAAIAGFAAARFLKSGNGSPRTQTVADDPWAGHLEPMERRQ